MTEQTASRSISSPACAVCGATTIGYMISIQGGTRTWSVASRRSKKVYCKQHAQERVRELDARDRRRFELARERNPR
jgi:hypothetical protein